MRRAAVLLLVPILLAGCGQSNDQKAMNHKFQRLDYEMSTLETINSAYNEQHFAKLTRQYIALVREYADRLGRGEVRRRLMQKGDELDTYCLPCTGTLYDAARKY